jgi:hypothetical protein
MPIAVAERTFGHYNPASRLRESMPAPSIRARIPRTSLELA